MSEYNIRDYQKIGARIAAYRKKILVTSSHGKLKSASQTELLALLKERDFASIGRNTLSDLENGVESAYRGMTLAQWDSLCTVFNCSIGHLLGEYECHNYDAQFIHEQTGLTEPAVDLLTSLASLCHNGILVDKIKGVHRAYALESTLDLLLRYPNIINVLYQFSRYNAYSHYCDRLREDNYDALKKLDFSISDKLYDAKLHCADAKNNLQEALYNILHYLEESEDQQWRNFQYEDN